MKSIIYHSKCSFGPFEIRDLEILRHAIEANKSFGITGFLHRTRHNYFQCIEGPKDHIDRLVANLIRDPRHLMFKIVASQHIVARKFSDWSMGYSADLRPGATSSITEQHSPEQIMQFLLKQSRKQARFLTKTQKVRDPVNVFGAHKNMHSRMAQKNQSTKHENRPLLTQ